MIPPTPVRSFELTSTQPSYLFDRGGTCRRSAAVRRVCVAHAKLLLRDDKSGREDKSGFDDVQLGDSDVYPDVLVACGQPEFVGDGADVIANPTVIVEVLSDAAESFDLGEKFRGYRAVPSVIDYLLVAHDRVRVEHYTRGRDDTWVLREH